MRMKDIYRLLTEIEFDCVFFYNKNGYNQLERGDIFGYKARDVR